MSGFDCSGLVLEILEAAGCGPGRDMTADGLYHYYVDQPGVTKVLGGKGIFGALAFYGEERYSHVAFCLDDKYCIEAGGGNSKTTDLSSAIRQNAFVRLRPIRKRKDLNIILRGIVK